MTEIARVLDPFDSFCPKCGHNRDTSSVSSIDEGDGLKSCQMCGTKWSEDTAEQVRQLLAAERERCARVCDAVQVQQDNDNGVADTGGAAACAAAIRKGTP